MNIHAILACCVVMVLLSGCVEALPGAHSLQMTFDNLEKVKIEAARIEVRDDYRPPLRDPHVEHLFPTPPYVAVATLAKNQLLAVGSDNVLRVIIVDASVVREALPTDRDFLGVVMREPSERLKATVLLRFELASESAPDIVLGHADITVNRTKTLMEGLSLADRDRATFAMTEDLMRDVNKAFLTVVRNSFGQKI